MRRLICLVLAMPLCALACLISPVDAQRPVTQVVASVPVTVEVYKDTSGKHGWLLRPVVGGKYSVDVVQPNAGGSYYLIVAVQDADSPRIDKTQMTLGGDGPGPVPPGPPVPPTPPVPPLSDLAKEALSWLDKLAAAERPLAKQLAPNFAEVSTKAAAGVYSKVEDMMADLVAKNQATMGTHREAWKPWSEACKAKLDSLYDQGKLKTVQDHAAVFLEISKGLAAGG